MSDVGPQQLAEMADAFAMSDFGERFLLALSIEYNSLHQSAELPFTMEEKVMKIERAAGVKWAIDWITTRQQLLKSGVFEEQPAEQ